MSWTAPATVTAGQLMTAAFWNTHVRDNLLETAAAAATTAGGIFVATGANAIAERIIGSDTDYNARTTASTSFVALTGAPAVTVTTDTQALAHWRGKMNNNTNNAQAILGVAVSGATTVAADDDIALQQQSSPADNQIWIGTSHLFTGLNGGSNVFTLNARCNAGTASYDRMELVVIPL